MPTHLPVLHPSSPRESPPGPSRLGWTGAGALITVVLWVLLGWIAQVLVAQSSAHSGWLWVLGPPILAFLCAAAAGGAFLGAFGPKDTTRPAIAAGALSAAFAWVAAMLRSPWQQALPALVVAAVLGALASWAGCRLIRHLSRRSPQK